MSIRLDGQLRNVFAQRRSERRVHEQILIEPEQPHVLCRWLRQRKVPSSQHSGTLGRESKSGTPNISAMKITVRSKALECPVTRVGSAHDSPISKTEEYPTIGKLSADTNMMVGKIVSPDQPAIAVKSNQAIADRAKVWDIKMY